MTYLSKKEAARERQRKYVAAHREEIRERQKRWRTDHADSIKAYQREYYRVHKDKIIAQGLKYVKQKRLDDPVFRNKARIRARIRKLVNSRGGTQSRRTQEILGCDFQTLWEYLLFTWECNYGKKWAGEPYEIDHFIPLALAESPGDVEKLCHYSNLQMLTPEDNMKKGSKYEPI